LKYNQLIDLSAIDTNRQHHFVVPFQNINQEHKINKIRLIKDAWDNIQIALD